jgi:hypothetical protein
MIKREVRLVADCKSCARPSEKAVSTSAVLSNCSNPGCPDYSTFQTFDSNAGNVRFVPY